MIWRRRESGWTGSLLAAAVALCLAPGAWAADEATPDQVGRSIFVVNDVDGQAGTAPPQKLTINADIVFSEDITTGAEAKTVIEFRDGSTFEIGPDAFVRIDKFIFNAEESTSQKAVQVTRGVFRYVSGYVAANQDTKIATPSGMLAIRGSVAEGIVDPDVPVFVYVGEGEADFSNGAGRSDLHPGSAIAVPSPSTAPMAPAAMPAAVAAQALGVIERRLPPREALRGRPAADETWLRRAGAANLVPAAVQAQHQAAAGAGRPAPGARGSLAGELGLLVAGGRLNLFQGRPGPRTAEQTAFLARAAHDNPNAAAAMRRYGADARVLHGAGRTVGTELVIGGVARAAPSAEIVRKVVAASVRANPGAGAMIQRHALDSYRGADRNALLHPGGAGPGRAAESVRPHERPSQAGPGHQSPVEGTDRRGSPLQTMPGRVPGSQSPRGQLPEVRPAHAPGRAPDTRAPGTSGGERRVVAPSGQSPAPPAKGAVAPKVPAKGPPPKKDDKDPKDRDQR